MAGGRPAIGTSAAAGTSLEKRLAGSRSESTPASEQMARKELVEALLVASCEAGAWQVCGGADLRAMRYDGNVRLPCRPRESESSSCQRRKDGRVNS